MANVSLFRRWRSQRFSDLVGQASVVRTLQNVLAGGSPARAYLFCGPRGTGKTSSARIFAKALNCERGPGLEPCNECTQCREIAAGSSLDVFEIDAASHTQVDKIRDFIVDKVHFAPVSARHKVYIIDEVHKLSTSSFNALLKTLEEPPSHVVFILATTHPHDMPPTILSRCQRYDFRPLTVREIRDRLEEIAAAEGISLDREAGDQLARAADGSLRDALVLLEQAVTFCGDQVSGEQVLELLGLVGYQVMAEMARAMHGGQPADLLSLLHRLHGQGRDLKRLASALLEYLRLLMLVKVGAPDETFADMAQEERESLQSVADLVSLGELVGWIKAGMQLSSEIKEGRQARLLWEMTLVRLVSESAESSLLRRIESLEAAVAGLRAGSGGGETVASDTPARRASPEQATPPRPSNTPSRSTRGEEVHARRFKGASNAEVSSGAASVVSAPQSVVTSASSSERSQGDSPAPRQQEASPVLDVSEPPKAANAPEAMAVPPVTAPSPAADGKAAPAALSQKEFWLRLMNLVREGDRRLYGVLADARLVGVSSEELTLGLPDGYTWHRQKIVESQSVLEDLAAGLLGRSVRVDCRLEGTRQARPATEEHDELVRRASGLFTGEIVEE